MDSLQLFICIGVGFIVVVAVLSLAVLFQSSTAARILQGLFDRNDVLYYCDIAEGGAAPVVESKRPGSADNDHSCSSRGETTIMALTIDDAPYGLDCTNALLDLLKEHNVRATFFIISSLVRELGKDGPKILLRMLKEGHEIANHGNEDHIACLLSEANFYASLDDCANVLQETWNTYEKQTSSSRLSHNSRPNNYYRPGVGFFHSRIIRQLRKRGMRLIFGSVFPYDEGPFFFKIYDDDTKVRWVLRRLRHGGIMVVHDRGFNLGFIKEMLTKVQDKKVQLCTISDMLSYEKKNG